MVAPLRAAHCSLGATVHLNPARLESPRNDLAETDGRDFTADANAGTAIAKPVREHDWSTG